MGEGRAPPCRPLTPSSGCTHTQPPTGPGLAGGARGAGVPLFPSSHSQSRRQQLEPCSPNAAVPGPAPPRPVRAAWRARPPGAPGCSSFPPVGEGRAGSFGQDSGPPRRVATCPGRGGETADRVRIRPAARRAAGLLVTDGREPLCSASPLLGLAPGHTLSCPVQSLLPLGDEGLALPLSVRRSRGGLGHHLWVPSA